MEKIKKFLLKLSIEERKKLVFVIEKIAENNLTSLDVKKLKGHTDIFRVRIGKNRVIFRREGGDNLILEISRRNDSTYKKL